MSPKVDGQNPRPDRVSADGPRGGSWHRVFLEHGKRGLRTKAEPEERDLVLARAQIGELMMRLELAEDLIEKRGLSDEWKRRKR